MDTGTIVTIAAFVISIFAANWLNQRSNERLIESLRNEMKADSQAIRAEIQAVRAEIQAIRAEIKNLENMIVSLQVRMERVERQLDSIFKPVLPK